MEASDADCACPGAWEVVLEDMRGRFALHLMYSMCMIGDDGM